MAEFSPADVRDLQRANWLAKANYKYKKFVYDKVKTPLLARFAELDGYDEQTFTRDYFDSPGEWFSSHSHILSRHRLGDVVFHQPTDQFAYCDDHDREKESPLYKEYLEKCQNRLNGETTAPEDFDKKEAVRALRRLCRKFDDVLRRAQPKPKPDDELRFARSYFDQSYRWDGWQIRIPNAVAVCSECGRKLNLRFYDTSLELWLEKGEWGYRFRVECDAARFQLIDAGCLNYKIDFRSNLAGTEETRTPWREEKLLVQAWLPTILPALMVRDLKKTERQKQIIL